MSTAWAQTWALASWTLTPGGKGLASLLGLGSRRHEGARAGEEESSCQDLGKKLRFCADVKCYLQNIKINRRAHSQGDEDPKITD